jgi:hypothetical protein
MPEAALHHLLLFDHLVGAQEKKDSGDGQAGFRLDDRTDDVHDTD